MQWFRLWCEISRDPKVRTMPRDCQLDFIYLLCMKGDKSLPNSDKNIAFYLQISEKKWKKNKIFILNNNLIFEKDGMVDISSWEKRQYKSDTSTDRVKKHREQVKRFSNVSETLDETHQNRAEQNIVKIKEKIYKKESIPKETNEPTGTLSTNDVDETNEEFQKRARKNHLADLKLKRELKKKDDEPYEIPHRWMSVNIEPLEKLGFDIELLGEIAKTGKFKCEDVDKIIEDLSTHKYQNFSLEDFLQLFFDDDKAKELATKKNEEKKMMSEQFEIKNEAIVTQAMRKQNAELKEKPKQEKTNQEYSKEFLEAWKEYPKRFGPNNKQDAWKAWSARTKEGCTVEEMLTGLMRYKKYCEDSGNVGTEFVKTAKTFFGPSKHFEDEYQPKKNEVMNATKQFGNPRQQSRSASQRTDELAKIRHDGIAKAHAEYKEAEAAYNAIAK